MLVLMPIGSKPTSPASVPSSTDGFFRNGMAAERSTIAMLCERIAGRVAGAPLKAADAAIATIDPAPACLLACACAVCEHIIHRTTTIAPHTR